MRTAHRLAGQSAVPMCTDTANDGHARHLHDHPIRVAVAAWACLPPAMARRPPAAWFSCGRLVTCSPGCLCNGIACISLRNVSILHCAPSCTAVLQGQQLHKHRGALQWRWDDPWFWRTLARQKAKRASEGLGAAYIVYFCAQECIALTSAPYLSPRFHVPLILFHLLHLLGANGLLEMKPIISVAMYVYKEYHP
jgi:hypothetical protein